ncbi:peptidoglycan-binding protein [Cyanobium sp. NIES-981]|uniref:peptidoglycan-binding domain-containing protein n=1 Tax=Cyanobium sp. NIES-981 TaxID=1851505 RepID=UPI000B3581B2|nr:peptidoglycan-binding domain-containing protein [Cyanobium sp. NIES-981]
MGIVESLNQDSTIIAIDGNTGLGNDSNGGRVMRRRGSRELILGFGRPEYDDDDGGESDPLAEYPTWPGRYITLTSPLMSGEDIQTWQSQMLKRGYNLGANGADGIFGEKSHSALKQFQELHNLELDGVIGPVSWNATWELKIVGFTQSEFESESDTPSRIPERLVTEKDN